VQNGWTDRNAVWGGSAHSRGPKEHWRQVSTTDRCVQRRRCGLSLPLLLQLVLLVLHACIATDLKFAWTCENPTGDVDTVRMRVTHPATTPSKDSDRSLRPRGRNYHLPVVTWKLLHQSFIPRSLFKYVWSLSILVLSIASVFCVLKFAFVFIIVLLCFHCSYSCADAYFSVLSCNYA